MSNHVFVSHSHEDLPAADLIVQVLEDRGITCWVAPRDVPHGMVFVPGLRFPSRAHQELFELTQQGGPSISPHKEQPGRCLFSEVVSLLLNRTFEYEGLCDDKSDQVRPSNNSKG
jgi:hypothetical protein